jgi:hypothetical protein
MDRRRTLKALSFKTAPVNPLGSACPLKRGIGLGFPEFS